MPKFRKKPVVIEATQWFKNGDHPSDYATEKQGLENGVMRTWTGEEVKTNGWEGQIVRYYRHPKGDGQENCKHCNRIMHDHGWIDTLEGGHIVCPGDFIITGIKGENYPCKPDIFAATYESLEVLKKRPTIEELEEILKRDDLSVSVNPDGSVCAVKNS